MSKVLTPTDYKIIKFNDSDWVRIDKNNEQVGMAMNFEEGLRAIHTFENKPQDYFFVADSEGVVAMVDRGSL